MGRSGLRVPSRPGGIGCSTGSEVIGALLAFANLIVLEAHEVSLAT